PARSAPRIVNGSFEQPANPPAPGNYRTIVPGQETASGFRGWKVVSGDIDVVDATAPLFGIDWGTKAAISGSQILDLNGTVAGSISQVFSTVAGTTYNVSFHYTNNPLGAGNESAAVDIINVANQAVLLTQSFTHTTATLTKPAWKLFQLSFTATGTKTKLVFRSTSNLSDPSGGIVLDAVKVSGI
ncbi:MAG: DUF642 domain-containing protein, partial [Thermosynechococcaceae cyanobacterium]